MFNPDWLVEAMTKVVSTMTMKEHAKTSETLSTKVLLAMLAGRDSASWHMVLMGHWSPTLPAIIARTQDIVRTTVSDLRTS